MYFQSGIHFITQSAAKIIVSKLKVRIAWLAIRLRTR